MATYNESSYYWFKISEIGDKSSKQKLEEGSVRFVDETQSIIWSSGYYYLSTNEYDIWRKDEIGLERCIKVKTIYFIDEKNNYITIW